jgi:peptide methionine sulfoxide reductase msrA/msrB
MAKDFAPLTPEEEKIIVHNDQLGRAYFAGGCFWGMEYYFQNTPGVISTKVGYMGGHTENPTYKQVCQGDTGHYETLEVIYNPRQTGFEELAKLFFEIHDFTQIDGQGPDIGQQYQSAVFYFDEEQKKIAGELIEILSEMGKKVATRLLPAGVFWPAEDYHQHYYDRNGQEPYCHFRRQIF